MPASGMTDSVQQLPPPPPVSLGNPPVSVILTVVLLVLFFVAFFSLCFCRSVLYNTLNTWQIRQSPAGIPVGPVSFNGLDPSIIEKFPTFEYGSVKGYRREQYGLECAICLIEFQDSDMLRLLTPCCHVFHQECVDLWLESHKTCPVCRRGLDVDEKPPEKSPGYAHSPIHDNESLDETFCISIKDENEDPDREAAGANQKTEKTAPEKIECDRGDMFPRSHSTGHSIRAAKSRKRKEDENELEEEEEDRFTLRLPEHVKASIIKGHNSTRSCTTFGEYHSKTSTGHGGFGEASGNSTTPGNQKSV